MPGRRPALWHTEQMPKVHANGIEIEYETRGERDGRPLVLVRGLGTQLIQWDPHLLEMLCAAGHFVVVFDNRDVGLSTHFHAAGTPDLSGVFSGAAPQAADSLAYGLTDMADDLVGLIDALDLGEAHVAGISMGGMIVQTAAIRHPDRIRSIASIMSSTGEPGLPGPTPEAAAALMEPAPPQRDAYVDYHTRTAKVLRGPGFPFDEAEHRLLAGRVFDRAFDPPGVARQLAAVSTATPRLEALARLDVPTLVIHGAADGLIPPACGEATARAIPGAALHLIDGMGHDLPAGAFEQLRELIGAHTRAAHTR